VISPGLAQAGVLVAGRIVDRVHVCTPDRELIRILYRALRPGSRAPRYRILRKKMYRWALKRHRRNLQVYHMVMNGI